MAGHIRAGRNSSAKVPVQFRQSSFCRRLILETEKRGMRVREVYIDSLFLFNFLGDLLMLRIAGAALGLEMRRARLCTGAAIGALYACAAFFLPSGGLRTMAVNLLALIVMCMAVFRPRGWRALLRTTTVTLLTAFGLGGGVMGLNFLIGGDALCRGGVWYVEISLAELLLLAAAVFLPVRFALRAVMQFAAGGRTTVLVRVCIAGRIYEGRALIDTGNHLRDPVTGKRVIVCDRTLLGTADFETLAQRCPSAVRMLPVVTVAGEDALLPAVRPDYIETEYQGRRVRCGEYLVAVSGGGLHADYHMVAGPELLENEEAAV